MDESLISLSIANGANIEQDRNVTATSYQYDNLNPGTTYEFSVKTRNIAGESGTETFTFQTGMIIFQSTLFFMILIGFERLFLNMVSVKSTS